MLVTESIINKMELYMLICRFRLNDLPMSALSLGATSFPAFSGEGDHTNHAFSQCVMGGPIPKGSYYIVGRQSGGRLGPLWDEILGTDSWFGLYADDLRIDDHAFCDGVRRGEFRLHPAVGSGRSVGCITLPFVADFMHLRAMFRSVKMIDIPCSDKRAYGKVNVE
jgi:hypothetical protein